MNKIKSSIEEERDIVCEQCGKFLFRTNKSKGAAGAEARLKGFIYKMPIFFGIYESYFFCCKECWDKWFFEHTTEEQRKEGNKEVGKLKESIKRDTPELLEGLQRIQKAFGKYKKKKSV